MELGIPDSHEREMAKQFRKVVSVSGSDRLGFLQGLISNDIERLKDGLIYAALLTPQGKYLFDFFLFEREHAVMVDVASDRSLQLVEALNFYKLRQSVEIEFSDVPVQFGLEGTPPDAFADPAAGLSAGATTEIPACLAETSTGTPSELNTASRNPESNCNRMQPISSRLNSND